MPLPRTQESRRTRRDGCIAREMRKPNHAALTAAVALLRCLGVRLVVRHGRGSRVKSVVMITDHRRIVPSAQPAAGTRPLARGAGLPQRTNRRRAEHGARFPSGESVSGNAVPGTGRYPRRYVRVAEELGLGLSAEDVVGWLDDRAARSGFVITPEVLWGGIEPELDPDPGEAMAVYRVGLRALLDCEPRLTPIPQSSLPVLQFAAGQ